MAPILAKDHPADHGRQRHPEHAVAMFRLLGGGVPGDLASMPRTQFAVVLPGTSHIGVTGHADMLMTMIRPSWTHRELPPYLHVPNLAGS
jgi:hypothetical protein